MRIVRDFDACPEELSSAQKEELQEQGFIAFAQALDTEEIEEARFELKAIVSNYIDSPDSYVVNDRGAMKQYQKVGSKMFFQLEASAESDEIDLELLIRKYMWFEDEAQIFRTIYQTHPRTRGVINSVLGNNSVLYQSMGLLKPPKIGIEKPWHQDNAYFSVSDLDGVLGSWIALDKATVNNGCMHFIPGGHHAGPLRHHHAADCEIVPARISPAEAVAVELPPGGIIFFHGNIPHYTPPNRSDERRRALQYHYRSADTQVITAEEYDTIFREADGTPASCAAARQDTF